MVVHAHTHTHTYTKYSCVLNFLQLFTYFYRVNWIHSGVSLEDRNAKWNANAREKDTIFK